MSVVGNDLAVRISDKAKNRRLSRGLSLSQSKQVAIHVKVFALTLGACLTLALLALEVPLMGLLGFAAPIFGIPVGLYVAAVEVVVFPIVFAMLILPSIATEARQ